MLNILKLSRAFRLFKVPEMEECDVLFVASPSDFMERKGTVYTSDKLGTYIEGAKLADFKVGIILLEGTGSLRRPAAFEVHSFPGIPVTFAFAETFAWLKHSFVHRSGPTTSIRDHLRIYLPTWSQVLSVTRPKVVIGIGLRQDLLQAARDLKIPTIEVQHGIASAELMKAYWPELAPDTFFVWDNHTADLSEKAGMKAVVTGHPHLSTSSLESAQNSTCQKAVAIALTYEAEDSVDPFGCFPSEVFAIAKELTRTGYALKFRLHPTLVGEKLVTSILLKVWILLRFPKSKVLNPKRSSVRDFASQTDFLLTRESSLAFEFSLFGRKAIVTNDEARVVFREHLGESFNARNLVPDIGELPPIFEAPNDLLGDCDRSFRGVEALIQILEQA